MITPSIGNSNVGTDGSTAENSFISDQLLNKSFPTVLTIDWTLQYNVVALYDSKLKLSVLYSLFKTTSSIIKLSKL